MAGGVEYQVTKVDPTNPETKGMVYQVHKVTEEVAATLGGKVYRARIINNPTEPTVVGKVYQIVLIDDPDDPAVKGKVYNAILTGGSEVVVIGPAVSPLSLPDAIADSLHYVKAFGGTEQRNLPDGYIERQFIYMMDDSYLVPGITPEPDWHIEMDFQTTSVSTAGVRDYFGGRYDSSAAGAGIRLSHTSSRKVVMYGFDTNNAYTGSSYNMADNTRYKYVYNNGSASLSTGGTVVDSTTFTVNDTTTSAIGINSYRGPSGSYSSTTEGIYLYSFKAWNGQGELVMDLVPAVQKGTVPVVGFYDTVSKTFKTATAGTFAAGGEAVPTPDTPMDIVSNNGVLKVRNQSGLPLGYTLLEYIESSGTQYIDTGVSGNATIKITAQASTTKGSSQALLSSTSGASGGTWFGEFTTNQKWGIGSGAGLTTINPTTKMTAEIAFDGSGCSGTVNGESITRSATITQGDWAIMATTQLSYPFSGKVWGCQITQSGTLVRNFIPCKNSSNVVGMYDLVNGVFYQNAGTGDFVAGSAVSDPAVIYTDGTVETINVHTKNLFDSTKSTLNCYLDASGTITSDNNWSISDYIPVQPSTNYYFQPNTTAGGSAKHCYYTSDKTFISSVNSGPTVLTTPGNCHYVRLSYRSTSTDVQLEQGSTATTYVPYFDGGTATAEMLLKVGDYQDVQSIIDGVVTRNVGVKVLDGTENWQLASGAPTRFYLTLPNGSHNISEQFTPYCTHCQGCLSDNGSQSTVGGVTDGVGFWYANQPRKFYELYLRLGSVSSIVDAARLKQYLADQYAAGTPVIVIYPLATPTTESVTGQTLQVQEGNNILEITQASLNGLELEAEYEKEGA